MKDSITLNADTLLDELMCTATRYCIGRPSYVSTYAEDYWQIIRKNWGKFNYDRLKFFARDIRAEVSTVVGFHSNVQVAKAYNDIIVYDAYTLLAKHLSGVQEIPYDKTFIVDCVSGEITEDERPTRFDRFDRFDPAEDERDLLPWIRLANCIDRQYEVTCEKDGKIEKAICIQDPDGTYTCVGNWYLSVNPEFIKEVKEHERV